MAEERHRMGLRLPESLYRALLEAAWRRRTSLNAYLVAVLMEHVEGLERDDD